MTPLITINNITFVLSAPETSPGPAVGLRLSDDLHDDHRASDDTSPTL